MTRKGSDSRKDEVFDIIVQSYVDTAEPVGSRTISRLYSAGLSPASIRNVMADLEDEGLISQPHTSAGRVPTEKGYRYYVDSLMEPEELSSREKEWVQGELAKARTAEALVERISKVISKLTENAALMYVKNLKRVSFLSHLLEELVEAERLNDFLEEESELFMEGVFRLLEQPEFRDTHKMSLFLRALDNRDNLLEIFVKDLNEEGVHVHIGRENHMGDLEDVSLVVKDWYLGGAAIGGVAVVGPTRMKYGRVVSVVDFVADSVTDAVKRF